MKNKDVVAKLNDKLFYSELSEHCYFSYLEYVETPIGDYIKYMGNYLWDSENDPRDWINDDEQEPLDIYLIKETKRIHKIIQSSISVMEKDE
jgi:hypothetical protein